MRVLMFGWEFPPHISGGLGTACYGLTKAMAKQDLEIIFVVPRAWGDEDQSTMQLVGANNIRVKVNRYQFSESDVAQANELEYVEIGANLIPYVTVEEYYDIVNNKVTIKKQLKKHTKTKELDTISFVGGYGESLLQEVGNYAFIASQIAKQFDFDIIQAHDWLTYDAGISAK
ncbi:MAG TPA: glycogen/starch synthase, partial [Bacteroidales bacterium]|nr:glycogen/starch synthase [Bacteroidales bacterium]